MTSRRSETSRPAQAPQQGGSSSQLRRGWVWFWGHFSTWLVLGLLLFLVIVNVGCERRDYRAKQGQKQPAVTTTATATATKAPRVVALAPGLAQMVPASLLVGRHGFDRWSNQSLAVCGDQEGIDYEALLQVRPTHVFLQWGQRPLPDRLTELARKEGWVIENLPLLDLKEIDAAQARIDSLLSAAGYTQLPTREPLNRASVIAGLNASRTVLLVYQTGPITILGPGSYHHQMLVNLGATPAIAPSPKASAFMKLELEDVLAIDPWAIIVIQPKDQSTDQSSDLSASKPLARDALGLLATDKLSAVRSGRIAVIDRSDALIPGPSLRVVRDEMASILRRLAPGSASGSTLLP